jgi:hypothetical protein
MRCCKECSFYAPTSRSSYSSALQTQVATEMIYGECRRYPPVIVVIPHSNVEGEVDQRSPTVSEEFFCGEWKNKHA